MLKLSEGLFPVLITPLKNDEIDFEYLRRLIDEIQKLEYVSGFWALGTGAEEFGLTHAQKLLLIDFFSEIKGEVKPLILGINSATFSDSLKLADYARDKSFSYVHYMPSNRVISGSLVIEHYKMVKERLGESIDLWGYHSDNFSATFGFDEVKILRDENVLSGVKYSTKNILSLQKVAGLKSENFSIISAVLKTMRASFGIGLTGLTSVELCGLHRWIHKIYAYYRAGDNSRYHAEFFRLLEFLDGFPPGAAGDNFQRVAEIKYLLEMQGFPRSRVVPGLRDLSDKQRSEISAYVESYPELWS